MKKYEKMAIFILVLAVSMVFCSCGEATPENVVQATDPPTETAAPTGDIKLMFYTTEIEDNMTAMVGESIELHAEVISDKYDENSVEWKSSCESSLSLEVGDKPNQVVAKVLSTEKSPVMLTLSCGDIERVFPVYIKPAPDGREAVQPGEIRLMFYTTELDEFTLREGETVQLYAEIDGVSEPEFLWTSSDESCLTIEHAFGDTRDAWVTAEKAVDGGVTLTISCGGVEKESTVYILPAE